MLGSSGTLVIGHVLELPMLGLTWKASDMHNEKTSHGVMECHGVLLLDILPNLVVCMTGLLGGYQASPVLKVAQHTR